MMARKLTSANVIDEELLSVDSFTHKLKSRYHYQNIDVDKEENDPPDFWVTIDGHKYAIEVTSIVNDMPYNARLSKFVKDIEKHCIESKDLSGAYLVSVVGMPEIPKVNTKQRKKMTGEARYYVCKTKLLSTTADLILLAGPGGKIIIKKISQEANRILLSYATARWEGEIHDDLCSLLQNAVSKKIKSFKIKGVSRTAVDIVLLLYDAYGFAEIEDVRKALKTVSGFEWFHSIFWIAAFRNRDDSTHLLQSQRDVQTLYSKEPKWRSL
jgi:hypothetical protein